MTEYTRLLELLFKRQTFSKTGFKFLQINALSKINLNYLSITSYIYKGKTRQRQHFQKPDLNSVN